MNTLTDLLNKYENDNANFRNEQEKAQNLIYKYERLLEKAKEKERKTWEKSPKIIDVVESLGNLLKDKYNFKYMEILGPFGLCCRMSIWLSNEPLRDNKGMLCIENIYSISLQPIFGNDKKLSFVYETEERTNKFAVGSIGDMNGFNIVTKPLPTDLEDIYNIMVSYHDRNNKKVAECKN